MTSTVAAKSFAHGVHPEECKEETAGLAIRRFPFAPVLIVPLSQHTGTPSRPLVHEGAEVARGQRIADPGGFVSAALHAPVSGIVERIGLAISAAGPMVKSVFLRPFPGSSQEVSEGVACDVETASPRQILEAIQKAGIVGLGGAAFPAHVKLSIGDGKFVDTVIINGAECEPYLTTDHRVMLERQDDILLGIRYLLKATGARRAVIGIETNKLDAIDALRAALPAGQPVSVEAVQTKYPQGAEKILIKTLLSREVPSGGLPVDVHVVVQNVATTAEIGRLLPHGRGILERVITITGPAVKKRGNYLIPIGTPVRFALEHVGLSDDVTRVFLGGPMMGQALSSLDVPIVKGTSGLVAVNEDSPRQPAKIYPCIRCGRCVDVCPLFLNPSRLGILAENRQYDRMASEYHLFDCFECGSCSYVCPSHIPLVQQFRISKAMLREKKAVS